MELEENIDICRLCMAEQGIILYDIFNEQNVIDSIVSKIWDCLGLKVFLGDGLPSLICHRCLNKLNRLDDFRKVCHRSNAHLVKQYNSRSQNSYKEDEIEHDSTNLTSSGIGCIIEGSEKTVQLCADVEEEQEESEVQEVCNEIYEASAGDNMSTVNLFDKNSEEEEPGLNMFLVKKTYLSPRNKGSKENSKSSQENEDGENNLSSELSAYQQKLLSSTPGSPQTPRLVKINSGLIMVPKDIPILQIHTEGKTIPGNETSQNTSPVLPTSASNNPNDSKEIKKFQMEGKYVKVPHEMVIQLSQSAETNTEKISKKISVKLPERSEPEVIHLLESPEKTTPAEVNVCEICDKVMSSKAILFQHYKTHAYSSDGSIPCPNCDQTFMSLIKMEKHMVTHCKDIRPFKCSICARKFCHSWQALRHEIVHSENSNFRCQLCSRKFTSEAYLNKHMKIHNKTHICDICNRAFSFSFQLDKHKSKFHQTVKSLNNSVIEDDDELICISDDDNQEKFTESDILEIQNYSKSPEVTESSMQNRSKRVSQNNEFENSFRNKKECRDSFQNKYGTNTLKLHSAHTDNTKWFGLDTYARDENKFGDSERSETNSDSSDSITVKANMYTCSMCLHIYNNIDDLMFHEQVTHNIKKIYSCINCMKMFTRQSYLVFHRKECEVDM